MTPQQVFSFEAAKAFIQTVVFVDDEVYASNSGLAESVTIKKLDTPAPRKHAGKTTPSAPPAIDPQESINARQENPFDLREMANAFADMGIVCALHQPDMMKSATEVKDSATFRICDAADICVLDWDMGGDNGTKAISLLAEMANKRTSTEVPPLQLVAVYTKRDDLYAVSNKIFEGIQTESVSFTAHPIEPGVPAPCIDYLEFKSLRIITLGKPGSRKTALPDNREVTEASLPERLIQEFARMSSGILQSSIISQMAVIRNRTHELLGRFSEDLDSAFLTHWFLNKRAGADAGEHLTPIMLAEMESILESSSVSQELNLMASEIEKAWKAAKPPCDNIGCKSEQDHNKKILKQACELHEICHEAKHDCLAALLANKTFYESPRTLTQGTIIECLTTHKYFVCLQPVCDSIRLKGNALFLFHVLDPGRKKEEKSKEKIGSIVVEQDGSFIRLQFKPNVSAMQSISFEPDSESECIQTCPSPAGWIFTASGEHPHKYAWRGQLKKDHALRIVNQLSSKLTRVGLTESEWLRLLNK